MNYTPDDFAAWLNNHITTSKDVSIIDVIPAPCGIGKSYSMTVQIAEALKDHNGGVLLVTDEVERLKNYTSTDIESSFIAEYINRNKERILIYTSENAKRDYNKLFSIPILLMTTQRFFNMSWQEVEALTSTYIPKRNVFVDERALLAETVKITHETFNDIDNALNIYLDDTCKYKPWMVDFWGRLKERYQQYSRDLEASHNDRELKIWFRDKEVSDHDRDNSRTFLNHCYTYLPKLRKYDLQIMKYIRAIMQMVNEDGALFISRLKQKAQSGNEYSNAFFVTMDYHDLLLNHGDSKAIVLDGTADLDPVYNAWYVNKVDCSAFKRDLSLLTINLINANTSRNAIARNPENNEQLKAIIESVNVWAKKPEAIFTYGYGSHKDLDTLNTVERQFARAGYTTGHFGGLKGTNRFNQLTNICQIGLNRIPDEFYFSMAIHNTANRYPPDKKCYIYTNFESAAKRVMLLSLLADIEQNLYRGVIRNADNDKPYTYTIYFDHSQREGNELAELTQMIKDRYQPFGATVNIIDTPATILKLKTEKRKAKDGNKTIPQIVINYVNSLEEGTVITSGNIIKDCKISKDQFDNAKKNKTVKTWLKGHRRDNRHYVA